MTGDLNSRTLVVACEYHVSIDASHGTWCLGIAFRTCASMLSVFVYIVPSTVLGSTKPVAERGGGVSICAVHVTRNSTGFTSSRGIVLSRSLPRRQGQPNIGMYVDPHRHRYQYVDYTNTDVISVRCLPGRIQVKKETQIVEPGPGWVVARPRTGIPGPAHSQEPESRSKILDPNGILEPSVSKPNSGPCFTQGQ